MSSVGDTQGSWIPEEVVASVLPETPKLTMSMSPTEWCGIVLNGLSQTECLHHLIDPGVKRPKPSDSNYKRWHEWSTTVSRWLYSNMDKDVQSIIDNMSGRPESLLSD
ncbi:hypothetical protein N7491_006487 [Penicillium cf. griseofulvum]|uniref:Uncharacterized protein n=1 Tax=Penicillium cf. griseofulvum TaxID=2972120 RepID=A0A9W9IWL2_9EURO|nr:hypothetical protein N7472_010483 [Penicillium cf. griseofulvum]KAJ5429471.1 hypothetical protein N7491_006487 [Penicillium cf. griseofulvum]KAJ5436747.1 hypothetical protein N7445_007632 [Penicillium cf. griseofulvum]